jgi:hypothetical protein
MLVTRTFLIADPISPDLIVAPDAVQQALARQGVDGPVERDPIDFIGKPLHDLWSAQRLAVLHENAQDIQAHRRPPKAGGAEQIGGAFGDFVHNFIIALMT